MRLSLKYKISAIILCIIFVAFVGITYITYDSSRDLLMNDIKKNAIYIAQYNAGNLSSWMKTRLSEVAVVANTKDARYSDPLAKLEYFKGEIQRSNGNFYSMAFCDTKGNLQLDKDLIINIASEPTFNQVLSGNQAISNPFPAKEDASKLIVTFEAPVYDSNHKAIGLISGASYVNDIFTNNLNFKIGKSSKVYLFQKDGLIIHDSNPDKVLKYNVLKDGDKSLRDIYSKIIHSESGFESVKIDSVDKFIVYSSVPGTDWIMAVDTPVSEVTSELSGLLWRTIWVSILDLLFVVSLVFFSLNYVFKRMEYIVKTTQVQSQTIEGFATTVEQMDKGIQDTTENMGKLASNVSNVSAATQQMGTSMQETAKNIEDAAAAINEASASIEQMGESIKSIAQNSKDAHREADVTVEKANEGNKVVGCAIGEMDKISSKVVELSAAVKVLGESAEKIGDIVAVIEGIAQQTNLLSLNASIEAARAGEAGNGFAVVANSIRVLAEKSGEATKDITKLIQGIQNEVKNAINLTDVSLVSVGEGVEQVRNTGKIFEEIFNAIGRTSILIKQIAGSTQQQEQGSKEIIRSVEKMNELISQLSATSQEQAAGSDEIVRAIGKINELMQQLSATTQEQAANSQEVVKTVRELSNNTLNANGKSGAGTTAKLTEQAKELLKMVGGSN